MEENLLYIHKYIPSTQTEGPGKRFTIWLQGCSIRCKGCMATHTWIREEGTPITVDELFNKICHTSDIEGITILGGEPLDQSDSLLLLLRKIKETPLTILLFTGYYIDTLTDTTKNEIVNLCDIVVDGPYRIEQQDFSRAMIGSSNQRIHFRTERYTQKEWDKLSSSIEIRISQTGEITINGIWEKEWMEKFLDSMS